MESPFSESDCKLDVQTQASGTAQYCGTFKPWKHRNRNQKGIEQDATGHPGSTADFARLPFWKRALDIACLVIAMPLLLPLMLVTALIVKVSSKGPLLFMQERVGFRGGRFAVLKFRTMVPGSDTAVHEAHVANLMASGGPMVKLDARGDPRLIPFGRQLRAAGLDELPQLINVLRGEMSLVGPRPCLPSEYDRYLPWQKERFQTLPGLTGLWQVSGKNQTTFNEMLALDIQYVRMQSPWLDLRILLKTIPAIIAEVKRARLGERAHATAAPADLARTTAPAADPLHRSTG